jgi:hypothetical protein
VILISTTWPVARVTLRPCSGRHDPDMDAFAGILVLEAVHGSFGQNQ